MQTSACMHMCDVCTPGVQGSQKRSQGNSGLSDPLGLELWMVLSYHMSAGN